MSDRFGNCNGCGGSGRVAVPIPGFPAVTKKVELTAEEKAAVRSLKTGEDGSEGIETTQRFFVRACYRCEGTPGFSGDAMEGYRG